MCAFVGARADGKPREPSERALSHREEGQSPTRINHGRPSPRRSTRLLTRSELALVCLALPSHDIQPKLSSHLAMSVDGSLLKCLPKQKQAWALLVHFMVDLGILTLSCHHSLSYE